MILWKAYRKHQVHFAVSRKSSQRAALPNATSTHDCLTIISANYGCHLYLILSAQGHYFKCPCWLVTWVALVTQAYSPARFHAPYQGYDVTCSSSAHSTAASCVFCVIMYGKSHGRQETRGA